MIKEKYILLTIPLLFSTMLFGTSITAYASINSYFKDTDEENYYENKFYREKYKEKVYSRGSLCDEPQSIKKYREICEG